MPQMPDHVAAQRAYWDNLYAEHAPDRVLPPTLAWIDALRELVGFSLRGTILEIGCGRGIETARLAAPDRALIGVDLSLVGLRQVAAAIPAAQVVQVALPATLPFRSGSFDLVIAGLSLHYFPRRQTQAIIADIRRLLKPGRPLVFRVNAAGDAAYGYGQGEEVEPGVFARKGRYKRFFTEEDCREAFADGWRIAALHPQIERRYGAPKHTWAGVAIPLSPA